MAKLIFNFGTMNAGKTAQLLQTEFNYRERGMGTLLLTAAIDDRFGRAKIASRLGISADAEVYTQDDDLMEKFLRPAARAGVKAVLVDEAQFLTRAQVAQLGEAVDLLDIPVLAYGLRTTFTGELFEGSAALLALADELREMRSICHCGKRATMVLRRTPDGKPVLTGSQIQIGGNDAYVALCRKHWSAAHAAGRLVVESDPEVSDTSDIAAE